jgi:hypothetical protein
VSHRCAIRECRYRYDVAADPNEHAPLDEPDTLAELRALLDARNRAIFAPQVRPPNRPL